MDTTSDKPEVPVIGILGWELRNEGTLSQFEDIPGNVANPAADVVVNDDMAKSGVFSSTKVI